MQCIFVYKPGGGGGGGGGGDEDQPGCRPTFILPLKESILLQCSLAIDVIKNFDYMT